MTRDSLSQELFEDDSDIEDEEEQQPAVKQPKKVPKSSEFVDTDSDNSDTEKEEPHSQKTSPGPVDKEHTQQVKTPSEASCTPVTFCTDILTSGIRKGMQCKVKVSDKTGKFFHLHKRQT